MLVCCDPQYVALLGNDVNFFLLDMRTIYSQNQALNSSVLCFDIVHDLDGVENADLVLLVTTRPTTGNTLAWAVACERDQWGRAIAGEISRFFL
jgi:hypothetical protein